MVHYNNSANYKASFFIRNVRISTFCLSLQTAEVADAVFVVAWQGDVCVIAIISTC